MRFISIFSKVRLLSFMFLLSTISLTAQTDTIRADSTKVTGEEPRGLLSRIKHYLSQTNVDKSAEKFDISFVGGPSYSKNTKLGAAVLAQALYRTDRTDLSIEPSNVAIFANFSTSGFIAVGADGIHIFPKDQYRIKYQTYFAYLPTRFYGIGYEDGKRNIYSEYDELRLLFDGEFLKKLFNHGYAGLTFTAEDRNSKKFKDAVVLPPDPLRSTIVGPGVMFTYDSRDFIPNPSKGIFLQYRQDFYLKSFGSSTPFNRIEASARAYRQLWKGTILAFDLNGIFNHGNVPWSQMSKLGNSRAMRGYYDGRYRARNQLNTQLEWRQHLWGRNGVVAFVGAGNVFNSTKDFEWSETLPDYGFGYRWEFKHQVNVRMDMGFGRRTSGFYLSIQEAF